MLRWLAECCACCIQGCDRVWQKLVVGDVFLETTLVETIIGLRRTDS